jgi:hypothetical protein
MNDIPEELRLFRSQLLDAIDRDLGRRSPHSRVTQRRSLRLGLPTSRWSPPRPLPSCSA